MAFRDDILPALDAIRGIPDALGLRVTTVTVRTRTWSGGRRGLGTSSDADVLLTPTPKVRRVTLREVSNSGGRLSQDDVIVDYIQPSGGGFGVTEAQVAPEPKANGVEIIYVLVGTGTHGINGNFFRKWAASDRALKHTLVLTRNETTPGNLGT